MNILIQSRTLDTHCFFLKWATVNYHHYHIVVSRHQCCIWHVVSYPPTAACIRTLGLDDRVIIIIGTGVWQLSEIPLDVIDLGNVQIQQSERVHSLGIVIDNTLSFEAHVNFICKQPDMHGLYVISGRVTTDVAVSIAIMMVGTWSDYCNTILYSTSKSTIHKWQPVQNFIARIVNVKLNVIAFTIRHKVKLVDTEARMVFLGGHPAKY